MASIQSTLFKAWIRRMKIFGGDHYEPIKLRVSAERSSIFSRPHRDVQVSEVDAASVPSEWLVPRGAPTDRAVLYIHGGAWFMGSSRTHRILVSNIAHASGVRALSINYRLAPEHPFPAALDDCLAVYEWLQAQGIAPGKIVVAGDSAGGNLALAMLVALRDAGKALPAGVVGISPATDLTFSSDSHTSRKQMDPLFWSMGSNTIVEDYAAGRDLHDPLISPIYADLRGLPPMLMHVGECETLYDDVVNFGKLASAAGVEARTVVWPGMFHVFQMASPYMPEARQAVEQIADFIRSRLAG